MYFGFYILYKLIEIILTISVLGSPGSWNCRSRVAGQADIAQSVEALGDKFRPAMSAGWLKYIQTAYAAGLASAAASSIGQGKLIVPDDE